MILMLACMSAPGENEDALGVPRKDLAGCTSHSLDDQGRVTTDVYDDRGHLSQRTLSDVEDVVIDYVTDLDDLERPVRTETLLDEGVAWEEWSWIGDSWKIDSQSRGRDAETYATTTWDWGDGVVTVRDDASPDCETILTMEGLRWIHAESLCPELIATTTQVWEDDRLMESRRDEHEFDTFIQQSLRWEDGMLAGIDVGDDEGTVSSSSVSWECP